MAERTGVVGNRQGPQGAKYISTRRATGTWNGQGSLSIGPPVVVLRETLYFPVQVSSGIHTQMADPSKPIDLAPFRTKVPTELHFGSGSLAEAALLARNLGAHALLVTGPSAMQRLGYAQQLTESLRAEGVGVTPFSELRAGPTTDVVDHGAEVARIAGADFVVGLGGGSAIDCAKAIAAVAPADHPAIDYLNEKASVGPKTLPIMAIPTTAGTGSEMNRSAIIVDPERRIKGGIRSDRLFPRYAIVDPALTHSVTRQETARTGFDCMTHAIESYVSPKATPETDRLARMAIRSVVGFLPVALKDPEDACAREQLALASTAMGVNLACVGTCFPHRVDKALCALHPEIPHAQSVALIYPYWIRLSYRGNVQRFAEISEVLEARIAGQPTDVKAAALPELIVDFLVKIGLDKTFSDFGVTEHEIDALADRVAGDLSVNPIPIERSQLKVILRWILTDPSSATANGETPCPLH